MNHTLRKVRFFLIVVVLQLIVSGLLAGQPDTIWNQVDDKGWKQGHWKKEYSNGKLLYRGFFKNNKPIGEMLRYYESGELKARLHFSADSRTTRSVMYFQNGKIAASGNYFNQQRDSTWNYYSYFSGKLSHTESYKKGLRNGQSLTWYPEGSKAEIMTWVNGKRHGPWKQYFENSDLRLSSHFTDDKLNGPYLVYSRTHKKVVEGVYRDGIREGDWYFYDKDGKIERSFKYEKGDILNREEFEKWADDFMNEVEKDLGTIPEPDYENFFRKQTP